MQKWGSTDDEEQAFQASLEMSRLKQRLISQFDRINTKVVSPKNYQAVEIYFSSEKMAKTIDSL